MVCPYSCQQLDLRSPPEGATNYNAMSSGDAKHFVVRGGGKELETYFFIVNYKYYV